MSARGWDKAIKIAIQPGPVEIGQAAVKNRLALEEQAYRLEVASSGIQITTNAPAGLFYGVETLVQLAKHAQGKLWLPAAEHQRRTNFQLTERGQVKDDSSVSVVSLRSWWL